MNENLYNEFTESLQREHNRLVSDLKQIATPDPRMKGDWDAVFPQFEAQETGSHTAREEEEDEVEEYEARIEAEHSLESRLLEVNRALERIQRGTYGKCLTCGKDIPLERLRANSAAAHDSEHSS